MSDEEGYDFQPRELSPVETVRHSTAHLLASAVAHLYPGSRFAIGPHVEHGFYYDMDIEGGVISEDDLPRIEEEMKAIAKQNLPFLQTAKSRDEALAWADATLQPFKRELIEGLPSKVFGFYTHGDFTDMCAGPHVRYSSKLKHFKLTRVAGAYWRGDEKRPMLTRVYGVAFETKEELEKHLHFVEEAKKRDHRKLGRELDLFMFHEWAPGSAFWLPHGEFIYNLLGSRMRELLAGTGYDVVRTPLVFDSKLFETSGHWEHYRDDMFHFPESHHGDKPEAHVGCGHDHGDDDGKTLGLKPMNCPSHMLIFRSRKRSYRELPLRIHDQGVLHRNERSGALSGLTRVRQFCQDDAHIFCRVDQIVGETKAFCELLASVYEHLGFTDVAVKLATRPDNPALRGGTEETWDQAERLLAEAVSAAGLEFNYSPGEGAFYGPKLEFHLRDAIGRSWQCGTLQLDFVLPERLDANYIGEDGAKHRPVMLHRAILGSFERFIGMLVEHYAGKFPLWLAPVQVVVATITQDGDDYANEVVAALRQAGIRAEADLRNEKINYKVREHSVAKVPVIMVIGRKEAEERTVSVRRLGSSDQKVESVDAVIAALRDEAAPPA